MECLSSTQQNWKKNPLATKTQPFCVLKRPKIQRSLQRRLPILTQVGRINPALQHDRVIFPLKRNWAFNARLTVVPKTRFQTTKFKKFSFSPKAVIKDLHAHTYCWLPSGRSGIRKWNCLTFQKNSISKDFSLVKIIVSSHLNFLFPPEGFNTSVTSSGSLSFFHPLPPSHLLYTSPALWQDLLGAMKRYCHFPPREYCYSARKDQPWWTPLANKRESLSIDFYTEGNHHYTLSQKLTPWSTSNTINGIFS